MTKQHVKVVAAQLANQHRSGMIKPEVLCIGPQKTGTTWLYANLLKHPQMWVPPAKELHFLGHGNYIPPHRISKVLFSSHWFYRGLRRQFKRKIQRCFSQSRTNQLFDEEMQWLLNYMLGKRSYHWYSSLFPMTDRVCIDISPKYYDLPAERIREYKAYNPTSKIIILIRDPIDRMWSLTRMVLCKHRGRSVDQVAEAEFIKFFDNNYRQWLPYAQTLALWQTCFNDVCVEFYDRLNDSPTLFFRNICTFLGIDETVTIKNLEQRVHEGLREPLPLAFRKYLYTQYAPEMHALADSGIGYARQWIDEHHAIINREIQ